MTVMASHLKLGITIRVNDIEATVRDGEWRCPSPVLRALLRAQSVDGLPDGEAAEDAVLWFQELGYDAAVVESVLPARRGPDEQGDPAPVGTCGDRTGDERAAQVESGVER